MYFRALALRDIQDIITNRTRLFFFFFFFYIVSVTFISALQQRFADLLLHNFPALAKCAAHLLQDDRLPTKSNMSKVHLQNENESH